MTENDNSDLPSGIVFIKIPEGMAKSIGAFEVNPSILVPVELGQEQSALTSLSWEMILTGMLRFLAFQPKHKNAQYYRQFIQAVKPDIFAELSETGILNAHNKEYRIAEEIFLALYGLAPDAPEPLLNLAILYEDQAETYEKLGKEELSDQYNDKAFSIYRDLLSHKKPYPDVFFNAAFFYLKKHSFEQALHCLEMYTKVGRDKNKLAKAAEIMSTIKVRASADTIFKEAYDFIRMGKEEEGIVKIKEFLKENLKVWNGWFLLGWAYRRLNRWDEGRTAFLEAIALGGDGVDTLNELAICEMEMKLLADSKKHLEHALYKEPENIKIISNLGILAKRMGKTEEAKGFFRTVLDIEPQDRLAKLQLDELGDKRN